MIVDDVARPFSMASITAAFAAWLLPTSSTLMIRILSVDLNPNRSASGGGGLRVIVFDPAFDNSNPEKSSSSNAFLILRFLTSPRPNGPLIERIRRIGADLITAMGASVGTIFYSRSLRKALRYAVSSRADKNLRREPCRLFITASDGPLELHDTIGFDEVDRAAAKSTAGHPRAENALYSGC